jgi:hypothetical protein
MSAGVTELPYRDVQRLQPCQLLSSGVIENPSDGRFGQATTVAPGRIGQISGKIIF